MTLPERLASEYAKEAGDDCLCQRTQPGTPVGEHIYCFCGCNVYEGFLAGYAAAEKRAEWKSEHDNLSKFAEDLRKERDALVSQLANCIKSHDDNVSLMKDFQKLMAESATRMNGSRGKLN